MSILDDYMRSQMLKVMLPSVNTVLKETREDLNKNRCFSQTVITITQKRHYPVRAHK